MTKQQAKTHAEYLIEHYKQSGNKGFIDMLFQRIVKQENLTEADKAKVKTQFTALLKA